jgi:hypothetical protein
VSSRPHGCVRSKRAKRMNCGGVPPINRPNSSARSTDRCTWNATPSSPTSCSANGTSVSRAAWTASCSCGWPPNTTHIFQSNAVQVCVCVCVYDTVVVHAFCESQIQLGLRLLKVDGSLAFVRSTSTRHQHATPPTSSTPRTSLLTTTTRVAERIARHPKPSCTLESHIIRKERFCSMDSCVSYSVCPTHWHLGKKIDHCQQY